MFSTGILKVSLGCLDTKHPQADLFLFLVEESVVHSKREKKQKDFYSAHFIFYINCIIYIQFYIKHFIFFFCIIF